MSVIDRMKIINERRDPDRPPEPESPSLELVAEKCHESINSYNNQIRDLVEKRNEVEEAWKGWDLDDLVRLGVIKRDLAKDAKAEMEKQLER